MTDEFIPAFGWQISNSSLYAFTIALAYLIVCLVSPVLSGIADFGGSRKKFMRIFTTTGSLACMSLFFFNGMNTLWIGVLGFLIASMSHAGSLVFYDAYLVDMVPPKRSDKLSAKGYAFGYIGSVILLVFNIAMIQKPGWFGISEQQVAEHLPVRFAFLALVHGGWDSPSFHLPTCLKIATKHTRRPRCSTAFMNCETPGRESDQIRISKHTCFHFIVTAQGFRPSFTWPHHLHKKSFILNLPIWLWSF